jgi:hypothetical protein
MWDAAAFELFIFTSPKMLVAAGRFDRPAHLRNDTWPASRVIDSVTEPLASPIHKEREEVIENVVIDPACT